MKLYKLALVASLLAPSVALAQSGPGGLDHKALDGLRRYWNVIIPSVATSSSPATMVIGKGGGLANVYLPSTATTFSITSTIASMPYAATIAVRHEDLGSATTTVLSCSQVLVSGIDQFGNDRQENLGTVSETYVSTSYAYDQITGIFGSGCNYQTGLSDTSDRFRAIVGRGVGVKGTIRRAADILSLCYDSDPVTAANGFRCIQRNSSGVLPIVPVYAPYNLITLPGTVGSAEANSAGTEKAQVVIRVRSSKW